MLTRHLAYWVDVLQTLLPHRQPHIELSVFGSPVLAQRLADTIRPALTRQAALLADKPDRAPAAGTTRPSRCDSQQTKAKPELGDGGLTT